MPGRRVYRLLLLPAEVDRSVYGLPNRAAGSAIRVGRCC